MVQGPDTMMERCSFCGRAIHETRALVAGPRQIYICDLCVDHCRRTIDDTNRDSFRHGTLPTPAQIVTELSQDVIGQSEAKRIIALAVYHHLQRAVRMSDSGWEKSNVLLIGPTGSGKTHAVRSLARTLDIPVSISDATSLTAAGYVGLDVEHVLTQLYQRANHILERAEQGIVYVDEIDKLARKLDGPTLTRDVGGECVQQALLKLLEGHSITVPASLSDRHVAMRVDMITVETQNVLFVAGGSFEGLEEIILRRLGSKIIGFRGDLTGERECREEVLRHVAPTDLIRYGLIPEFVGRFPVVAVFSALTKDELIRILHEPRNSLLEQYTAILAQDGMKLEMDADALELIAGTAHELGLGARGLRRLMEIGLREVLFDAPDRRGDLSSFRVSSEYIRERFAANHLFRASA